MSMCKSESSSSRTEMNPKYTIVQPPSIAPSELQTKGISDEWRIQDFPDGRASTSRGGEGSGTYRLTKFSPKLHETKSTNDEPQNWLLGVPNLKTAPPATDFYHPQRNWGKVIFSEACVKNSVQRGGGCDRGGVHGRGACVAGGCALQGGHPWQGASMAVGACMAGGHCGRYYEIQSMSGQYASYWNAFLLITNYYVNLTHI